MKKCNDVTLQFKYLDFSENPRLKNVFIKLSFLKNEKLCIILVEI